MNKKGSSLYNLAKIFSSMPGVGPKAAWKLVFYILTLKEAEVKNIVNSIIKVHKNTKKCKICQNLTDCDICEICSDKNRDESVICVVESPKDIINLEKSNTFTGKYHILHGLLSPIKGIGPNDITIKELIANIKENKDIKEVILATSPTVEGDCTASYISKVLKPYENIKVTRLGFGISVGSEIQYADSFSIIKALENRNRMF